MKRNSPLGKARLVAEGFPAVFNGIISVSGLEDSLQRGAWSLDIFRPGAVETDEASD